MESPNRKEANMNLTDLEVAMLEAALGYDDRELQHSDNHTNLDLDSAHRICGGKHQAAGVIGSLAKKGLVMPPEECDDIGLEIEPIWLTHEGVDAIFDHMEANR